MHESVLCDERAVEVARKRLHVAREVRRQLEQSYCSCVRNATRSATCFCESDEYDGIAFG